MSVQRISRRDALKAGVGGLLVGLPLMFGSGMSVRSAAAAEDISGYKLCSG